MINTSPFRAGWFLKKDSLRTSESRDNARGPLTLASPFACLTRDVSRLPQLESLLAGYKKEKLFYFARWWTDQLKVDA